MKYNFKNKNKINLQLQAIPNSWTTKKLYYNSSYQYKQIEQKRVLLI